jgi:hypothetical protein
MDIDALDRDMVAAVRKGIGFSRVTSRAGPLYGDRPDSARCLLDTDRPPLGFSRSFQSKKLGRFVIGIEMGPKRVELAHELVPNASTLGLLINSKFPLALAEMRSMQAAAQSLGLEVTVLDASSEGEIDAAFAVLAQHKPGALIINTDPLLLGEREKIVQLAARYKVPTLYFLREFVDAGGSAGRDLRRSHS